MKKIYFVIFVFVLFLLAGCGETVNIEFVTNGGSPVEAINVKGWLVFKSTYSRFLWDLIYDSHVVIE